VFHDIMAKHNQV